MATNVENKLKASLRASTANCSMNTELEKPTTETICIRKTILGKQYIAGKLYIAKKTIKIAGKLYIAKKNYKNSRKTISGKLYK